MKYKPIFGDQSNFDKADADAVCAYYPGDGFSLLSFISEDKLKKLTRPTFLLINIVAMRRIIHEPKRWTVEDQKAGLLPDVGCEYIGRDVLLTCVFVDKNRDVWGKSKDNLIHCHDYSEIKPIETSEEKAARLRSEWCAKAAKTLKTLEYNSTLTSIYDALLSGDLPAPVKGDE